MSNENKDNNINIDEDNNKEEEDIDSTNTISQINFSSNNIKKRVGLLKNIACFKKEMRGYIENRVIYLISLHLVVLQVHLKYLK